MKNVIDTVDRPGLWIVWTTVGYSICLSLKMALEKAYLVWASGQASPFALGHFGTDVRLDANDIVGCWHELGWIE